MSKKTQRWLQRLMPWSLTARFLLCSAICIIAAALCVLGAQAQGLALTVAGAA